jgi:hypothetical protein
MRKRFNSTEKSVIATGSVSVKNGSGARYYDAEVIGEIKSDDPIDWVAIRINDWSKFHGEIWHIGPGKIKV